MTYNAHFPRPLLALVAASAMMLPLSINGASSGTYAIVDANGYIAPGATARVEAEADISKEEASLLRASGSANTQVEFGALSGDAQASRGTTSAYGTVSGEAAAEGEDFFSRLKLWGKMLISFFGLGEDAQSTAETAVVPYVTTTSSTARLTWEGSPSLVARVYYSSTSPVRISPESPYVTAWGMATQEAELEDLSAGTTYYYRIVPVGLGVTASSSSEFYFTTNAH